jgi:hypothetical protein
MKSGNGKIANLPSSIQEQLNYRMNDDEPGNELVAWLNSKPEVIAVLREHFDGKPISEQNLSEWRKHGFQKWLIFHNIVDESDTVSENAVRIDATGIDCEKLLLTLKANYAEMIQCWTVTPVDEMNHKLSVFKNITNAVIAMRRAEILKVRLEIEHAKLEILWQKHADKSGSSASAPVSSSAGSIATVRPKAKGQSANQKSAPVPAEPPSDPPAHRPPPPQAASADPIAPSTWAQEPRVRQPGGPPMPDRVRTFHRVFR